MSAVINNVSTPRTLTAQERFARFVSLNWYDSFLDFIFKFAAKTSEPLLALGLVVSATDFLTKGALMAHNPALVMAWAWMQAVAIETSSGVVFVYALQSFKEHDKAKGVMYIALSVLLAVTAGSMLLLQLLSSTTGLSEAALPLWLSYGIAALRVVVSVAYVFMCRAKYIRFSGVSQPAPIVSPSETPSGLTRADLERLFHKIEGLEHQVQELSIRRVELLPLIPPTPSTGQMESITMPLPSFQPVQPEMPPAPPVTPVEDNSWLLEVVPDVSMEEVQAVLDAFQEGIPRRDMCAYLKWGMGAKYSRIVKAVLDAYEARAALVSVGGVS